MFVKAEKLPIPALETKLTKDPRAIQFRGIVYSAALARYTLAMERTFYLCTPGATKGKTHVEKGGIMSDIIQKYANPAYLELDCSRFDAHVSKELLRCDHHFYNSWCSDAKLADMLRMQLSNVAYSRTGLKYKLEGGRMSGDMNTALGNNVLQWGMITVWLRQCGIQKFDFVFDGDDSVIVVERKDVHLVDVKIYESYFGMSAKLKVLYDIEKVEYCKGYFFGRIGELIFARSPMVAIHKDRYTTKLLTSQDQVDSYMYTLGLCMAHQYDQVPIMWQMANAIRRRYPKGSIHSSLAHEVARGTGTMARPPLPIHRTTLEFHGVTEAVQLRLEKSILVH